MPDIKPHIAIEAPAGHADFGLACMLPVNARNIYRHFSRPPDFQSSLRVVPRKYLSVACRAKYRRASGAR